ncbi:hypothetical protein CK203_006320 [Vitis vinifera]|uniref:DUF4218 domain-containing protein n=1 Tax=Vitis vinifera TaxID=29760 RepID=A0A438KAL8_VITVI|nr:hypothetical protein CK203_006320 [Vitis vinifera]
MFQSSKIAKDLIWHAQSGEFDGKMRHPSDSPSWKVIDHRWPDFSVEPRNLRLAISADGINPHSSLSSRKTKDGLNSRLDLMDMGLRCELAPRFMKVLKGYVRNRNHPEGCIVECYITEEAIEFCTEYLSNMDAIGVPSSTNVDHKVGAPIPGDPFILASQVKQVFYVQDQLDLRWSVVLSTPPRDFSISAEDSDDFMDNSIEHHPLITTLPQVESFDTMDDSDVICIRGRL